MKAFVNGRFMESGFHENSKTKEKVPFVILYTDKDTVQIFGVDFTEMKEFEEYTIPCSITLGNYGLYVKAITVETTGGNN